jgi:hypothetical protein
MHFQMYSVGIIIIIIIIIKKLVYGWVALICLNTELINCLLLIAVFFDTEYAHNSLKTLLCHTSHS